jgi:predicted RNase H-like HicB family nuclease
MKTYMFSVELEEEDDGRFSAVIPDLPGCATWGYTAEEALKSIHEAAQAYIEVLFEDGKPIPEHAPVEVLSEPIITVTV